MARLVDLEPRFLRREVRIEPITRVRPEIRSIKTEGPWVDSDFYTEDGPREHYVTVDVLAEADGLWFMCPMPECGHSVLCWFFGRVPDDAQPKPGRWVPSGTGFHDLSFVGPSSASVLLTSGCRWHGYIRNGDVSILSDSGAGKKLRR